MILLKKKKYLENDLARNCTEKYFAKKFIGKDFIISLGVKYNGNDLIINIYSE